MPLKKKEKAALANLVGAAGEEARTGSDMLRKLAVQADQLRDAGQMETQAFVDVRQAFNRCETELDQLQQFINGLQHRIANQSGYEDFLNYIHEWQSAGAKFAKIGTAMGAMPAAS